MALTNFRASDFSRKVPEDRKPKATAVEKPTGQDQVPVGTTEEILTWVGEDSERAGRALEAELANGNPRASVLEVLQPEELEEEEEQPALTEPADVSELDKGEVEVEDYEGTYPHSGSADAVKTWVGDGPDADRVAFALTKENERSKPRKGVLDFLGTVEVKA